jgi:hypothetical protein
VDEEKQNGSVLVKREEKGGARRASPGSRSIQQEAGPDPGFHCKLANPCNYPEG